MWIVAIGLALLVEVIFIMHKIDPGYYGFSLELYKVLRIAAVVAVGCGVMALWLSLRKKEKRKPAWLIGVFMALTLVPTVHWVVRNDYFRTSSLLERRSVKVHELVAYLKDYPETKPKQVAQWLFKYKGGREKYAEFVAHQLSYFVMGLPSDLKRYREPVIAAAHQRLQRLKKDQQFAGYRAMVRTASAVPHLHNERRMKVLAEAGGRIVEMQLAELTPGQMGSWPPGTRRLFEELKQKSKISFPLRAQLELKDEVQTKPKEKHAPIWSAVVRCGLLDTLAAHGLMIQPAEKKSASSEDTPAFRVTVKRTNETVKRKFTLGNRAFKNLPVPVYTLDVAVYSGDSDTPLYTRRSTTSQAIFRSSVTSKKTRGGLTRELRRRAMRYACSPIARDFQNPHLFPPRKTTRKKSKRQPSSKAR